MNECRTCKYWIHLYHETGECHRYAPRPTQLMPMQDLGVVWPQTVVDEGCGEHRDRDNA